jgi:hypothetical protein
MRIESAGDAVVLWCGLIWMRLGGKDDAHLALARSRSPTRFAIDNIT